MTWWLDRANREWEGRGPLWSSYSLEMKTTCSGCWKNFPDAFNWKKVFLHFSFPHTKGFLSVGCVKLSVSIWTWCLEQPAHSTAKAHRTWRVWPSSGVHAGGKNPNHHGHWEPQCVLSLFRPSCEHSVFIAAVVVITGRFDMIWHFSRGAASPSGHVPGRAECHYVENGCCCELPPSRGISLCKCWA